MNSPSPSSILKTLQVDDFTQYLPLAGWQQVDPENSKWYVFQGANDIDGHPLEIVLPRNPEAPDLSRYLENAVNLLAELDETTPEYVAIGIRAFDRDILRLRNIEGTDDNSISLKLAANQVLQDFRSSRKIGGKRRVL